MSGMSREFYEWDDYIHGGGPMPIGGSLWGGRIGDGHVFIPPDRQYQYPFIREANSVWRDQAEFFNGGPMSFAMRDRWSPGFGNYGPYEDRRWRRRAGGAPQFQILW
jgi:hypothetical protein